MVVLQLFPSLLDRRSDYYFHRENIELKSFFGVLKEEIEKMIGIGRLRWKADTRTLLDVDAMFVGELLERFGSVGMGMEGWRREKGEGSVKMGWRCWKRRRGRWEWNARDRGLCSLRRNFAR